MVSTESHFGRCDLSATLRRGLHSGGVVRRARTFSFPDSCRAVEFVNSLSTSELLFAVGLELLFVVTRWPDDDKAVTRHQLREQPFGVRQHREAQSWIAA
jgi:hypothetical protein